MTTVFERAGTELKKWNLVVDKDVTFNFDNKLGVELSNDFVQIKGNFITVKAGYAWNGLESSYFKDSKIVQFAIGLLKKADGVMTENGLPHLWQATLLYDVFKQYSSNGQLQSTAIGLATSVFSKFLLAYGVNPIVVAVIVTALQVFGSKK